MVVKSKTSLYKLEFPHMLFLCFISIGVKSSKNGGKRLFCFINFRLLSSYKFRSTSILDSDLQRSAKGFLLLL